MRRPKLLFLLSSALGCAHPAAPGQAAAVPAVVASPVVDACVPARARGLLIAHQGAWRLFAGAPGQGPTLEHVGRRRPSDDEIVALRAGVATEIEDPWIVDLGVAACDSLPGLCLAAGLVPGTRPLYVARRLDHLLGGRDDDLCYDVKIADAVEVFADDGSCLPMGFHGPLVITRGPWRLYEADTDGMFMLEHVGRDLTIEENKVRALRHQIPGAIVDGRPINMLAHGLCGTNIPPRRGQCLMLGLKPGTDPFRGAEVLERTLGTPAADLCYGVRLMFEEPVFLREDRSASGAGRP